MSIDSDRRYDYEDSEEERTQASADGGGDAGLVACDEDADDQRQDDDEETESDATEGQDDTRVTTQHTLAEREEPQRHHNCNGYDEIS